MSPEIQTLLNAGAEGLETVAITCADFAADIAYALEAYGLAMAGLVLFGAAAGWLAGRCCGGCRYAR